MRKTIKIILIILLLVFLTIAFDKALQEKTIELPYPYVVKLEGAQNKYFCEALVGSVIEAPTQDMGSIKKGVRVKAFKGTDKLSIEIKDDKLYFLTRAAFEAGETRDENPFIVLYNDKHTILAVDKYEPLGFIGINVFTLNKDTGIAVWAKTRAEGFFTGNPDSQSYCLKCEPR